MPLLDVHDPGAVARAARALAAGELVALPTETVYGLGARADDDAAVGRIYAAKGRPDDHPLIVHVCDAQAAEPFALELPERARRLMARLWPGPLTVVVRRRPGVAQAAAAGLPTVGLRCPDHPVAQALLRAARDLGVPGVAAPSANRFGRVSPTRAAHVAEEFGPGLLVLDGGPCREGIESAIVDCSRNEPHLLRPGTLSREDLEAALGEPLREPDAAAPRVSGSLASHYAPRAAVHLLAGAQLQQRLQALDAPQAAQAVLGAHAAPGGVAVGVYSRQPLGEARWARVCRMPDNPGLAAHELFAVLREFDALGVQAIWVEQPPDLPAWEGVRDRLRRAATR